jgi:hypothetical protein
MNTKDLSMYWFCFKIQLPKGFIWKLAEEAKSRIMHISTPHLNFDDSGKNAFYSVVEFKGP